MSVSWAEIEVEARLALREQSGCEGLAIDVKRVRRFAAEIASGALGRESNWFPEDPVPAGPDEIPDLAQLPEERVEALREQGAEALASGELAVAVLNGGMATRFGGTVKGVLPALGGRSFLELKLAQARRAGVGTLLVMNSFATERETLRHLAERRSEGVACFLQDVSLRLTSGGEVFRDARGALSLYAPGHGDFPDALRRSGWLARLRDQGKTTLMLSNVDNLGAEPDPLILGYHLAHAKPLTCEVARAEAGDRGGTPAKLGGRMIVAEGFRFSPRFDPRELSWLSTNTFLFQLDLLERAFPLSWFYVEKTVDGRPAVQMERLVNELSSFAETSFLATPRRGPAGRFLPIKTPRDLDRLRGDPVLVERFGSVQAPR